MERGTRSPTTLDLYRHAVERHVDPEPRGASAVGDHDSPARPVPAGHPANEGLLDREALPHDPVRDLRLGCPTGRDAVQPRPRRHAARARSGPNGEGHDAGRGAPVARHPGRRRVRPSTRPAGARSLRPRDGPETGGGAGGPVVGHRPRPRDPERPAHRHPSAGGEGLVASKLKSRSSYRVLVLPGWCLTMLRARRRSIGSRDGPVFADARGWLSGPQQRRCRISSSARQGTAFEWVTPHTYRKTVATLLDSSGASARMIADQLGHSRVSMTQDVYMGRRAVSPSNGRGAGGVGTRPARKGESDD